MRENSGLVSCASWEEIGGLCFLGKDLPERCASWDEMCPRERCVREAWQRGVLERCVSWKEMCFREV